MLIDTWSINDKETVFYQMNLQKGDGNAKIDTINGALIYVYKNSKIYTASLGLFLLNSL